MYGCYFNKSDRVVRADNSYVLLTRPFFLSSMAHNSAEPRLFNTAVAGIPDRGRSTYLLSVLFETPLMINPVSLIALGRANRSDVSPSVLA